MPVKNRAEGTPRLQQLSLAVVCLVPVVACFWAGNSAARWALAAAIASWAAAGVVWPTAVRPVEALLRIGVSPLQFFKRPAPSHVFRPHAESPKSRRVAVLPPR